MPHDVECEIFTACTSSRITVEVRRRDSTVHGCNSFLTVPPPKVTQLHRARTMSIALEYLDSNAAGTSRTRLSTFHPQEWYASSFDDVIPFLVYVTRKSFSQTVHCEVSRKG